jgi:hypothetical protein
MTKTKKAVLAAIVLIPGGIPLALTYVGLKILYNKIKKAYR